MTNHDSFTWFDIETRVNSFSSFSFINLIMTSSNVIDDSSMMSHTIWRHRCDTEPLFWPDFHPEVIRRVDLIGHFRFAPTKAREETRQFRHYSSSNLANYSSTWMNHQSTSTATAVGSLSSNFNFELWLITTPHDSLWLIYLIELIKLSFFDIFLIPLAEQTHFIKL